VEWVAHNRQPAELLEFTYTHDEVEEALQYAVDIDLPAALRDIVRVFNPLKSALYQLIPQAINHRDCATLTALLDLTDIYNWETRNIAETLSVGIIYSGELQNLVLRELKEIPRAIKGAIVRDILGHAIETSNFYLLDIMLASIGELGLPSNTVTFKLLHQACGKLNNAQKIKDELCRYLNPTSDEEQE
jgi:hypothetical protein